LNDILKEKQLNLATFTKPAVSIEENVTCGNNHTTIKPSSSEITPRQLTTHCSTEVEFKVPNLKCSNAKNIHDTTPSEPRKENFEEPAFPVFRSTRNKGHSASSSESGDDIDALSSLKKSLLNIGNKTGLMDFATPRNKSSDQIRATTTDSKYFIFITFNTPFRKILLAWSLVFVIELLTSTLLLLLLLLLLLSRSRRIFQCDFRIYFIPF
jgi:hypothetical protein